VALPLMVAGFGGDAVGLSVMKIKLTSTRWLLPCSQFGALLIVSALLNGPGDPISSGLNRGIAAIFPAYSLRLHRVHLAGW
jgi:hypothetical protein